MVSWIKAHWRADRIVGAIFANIKSAFPSVHHPRLIHTLETQGYPPLLINIIHNFLAHRETFLAFNGFESKAFYLGHGLPQGLPLSPLLYLLYNNSLLAIADTHSHSKSLGFVDDVVLLTAGANHHELRQRVQTLADLQIAWAARHGAIFDTKKSKWLVFEPKPSGALPTINFGDWLDLLPVHNTKWLGITFDSQLTFKRHCDNVIAKGKKRASYLSSLSNTRWGVTPKLFKILLSSTVHAATDYAVAAWMNLPVPKFFAEKLMTVDAICATRALGALRNSPMLFLRHHFDLQPPEIRLTSKILNAVAIIAAKPPTHPLHSFYAHAQRTNPRAHKNPFHAYFQSPLADTFRHFNKIQRPNASIPLPLTPQFNTLIIKDKEKTIRAAQALRPVPSQIIVFSDGSRIEEQNTAAAAWCENTGHHSTQQLGKATEYGVSQALL